MPVIVPVRHILLPDCCRWWFDLCCV